MRSSSSTVAPSRSGFQAAADAAGLASLVMLDEGEPGSEDARAALLAAIADGGTALFIHNDQLATRTLLWLESAGLDVPGDVAVLCYDDVIAGVAGIPLTALAPPKQAVGRRAVERALELCTSFAGADARMGEHIELVPRLNVRESTAAARIPVGG